MLTFLVGCAGANRQCSAGMAKSFGANWVVAQCRYDGSVLRCWKLSDASIDNEPHSDGIYWQSPEGHLVHISGWYNRVQVSHAGWEAAAASIGVDLSKCGP